MIQTSEQPATFVRRDDVAVSWRHELPVLMGETVMLRELRLSDAPSLVELLNIEEVTRFIAPPPTTIAGFERFISWAHRDRAAGRFACFGITPHGCEHAVGIVQIRAMSEDFETAEWGIVLSSSFWGTGVFPETAQLVIDFTFNVLGAMRLEARADVANGRANGGLQKIGATREGLLRRSFLRDGTYHDQVVWSITRS